MPATRIPLALQKVFLSSNSGNEVNEAPSGNLASKTFLTNWSRKGGKAKYYIPKVTWSLRGASTKKRSGKRAQSAGDAFSATSGMSDATNASTKVPDTIQFKAPGEVIDIPSKAATLQEHSMPEMSPQDYLHRLLTSRGYATASRSTLESGYYATPTQLQQASYHSFLIGLARYGKKKELKDILECGVSPNPCNIFGESLVHAVCRRCDPEILQILVDAGASLQVSDDYGRTPLHDACWRAEPSFEIIEIIANRDLYLFHMADARGALPLSYVHKEHWGKWNKFLESKKEVWWPKENSSVRSVLATVPPNSQPIQDPENPLKPEIAAMLTAGRITPKEAIGLKKNICKERIYEEEQDDEKFFSEHFCHPGYFSDEDSCDEDSFSDDEDYSCSSDDETVSFSNADCTDSSDDFSLAMNEDDMADILGLAAAARAQTIPTTMASF